MRYPILKCISGTLFVFATLTGKAQPSTEPAPVNEFLQKDSITRNGYTLIVLNKAQNFSTETLQRMITTFFKVYPQQAKLYNKKTLKKVTFIIDPAYDGVAGCSDGIITYSPDWLTKNPEDIDVVTHEGMHIVQDYPGDAGPGWVTEGIADYVRYTLGVNNEAARWALPTVKADHHYENAYRVTARFFVWLEKKKKAGIVKKLDTAMRTKTYKDSIWKDLTGSTIEELWKEYSGNSNI